METDRLINSSGFFISSLTTVSLAVMLFEYIISPLISLFNFSFIIILFLLSVYLRSRFFHKIAYISEKPLSKITYITTFIMGLLSLFVFIYFGLQTLNVTFQLNHYSFNPYLMAISLIWAAYSSIEILTVNTVSDKYQKSLYLSYFSVIIVVLSVFIIGYIDVILPIALLVLSISTAISGIRIYSQDYTAY